MHAHLEGLRRHTAAEKLEMLKLFQLFVPLLQLSKRWEVDLVALPGGVDGDSLTRLANIPTLDGRICKLMAPPFLQSPLGPVRCSVAQLGRREAQ